MLNLLGGRSEHARERRHKAKAAMPRIALSERHTEGCIVLPSRIAMLSRIPSGGIACEVGVADGDFTHEIIERNRPNKLHLVDSWGSGRYGGGLARVEQRFHDQIAVGMVEINRGLSTEKLSEFTDRYFDWVYIDTNHAYETTAAELRLCALKVKDGGRIAGHDFCTGNVVAPVVYGVIEACLEFCVRDGWRFEFLTLDPDGHFSFCLRAI